MIAHVPRKHVQCVLLHIENIVGVCDDGMSCTSFTLIQFVLSYHNIITCHYNTVCLSVPVQCDAVVGGSIRILYSVGCSAVIFPVSQYQSQTEYKQFLNLDSSYSRQTLITPKHSQHGEEGRLLTFITQSDHGGKWWRGEECSHTTGLIKAIS